LTQYEMLKKLELSYDDFREIKAYCDEKNISFMSTPDEESSAKFLLELQDTFKIGSGEIDNIPFLRLIGSFNKNVIVSTGMSNMAQVTVAFNTLIGAGTNRNNITILHANTSYPTPMHDVNLRAMQTIRKKLGVKVGYSDHTLGWEVSVAAVALGASVIEKHFTLDRTLFGPDHSSSLLPNEFKLMVNAVRNVECALGSPVKIGTHSEMCNIKATRKSIVAKCNINKGDLFTTGNITVKRSKEGISANQWDDIIGETSKKSYIKNEIILV